MVEISSDGGSTWAKVPVNYPGNSTNTSDACGLPTGTYFTGSGTPTWAQYTASLATWANQDVILRWRLSTDGSVTYQGWWVDDIAITNVMVPGDCDSRRRRRCSPTTSRPAPPTPGAACCRRHAFACEPTNERRERSRSWSLRAPQGRSNPQR